MEISPLLRALINAEFCTTQSKDTKKDNRAYFCVDCGGDALTEEEREKQHGGHKIIRAMKNSREYSYRNGDIESLFKDVLDPSWICVYTINSTNVYFPKPRNTNPEYRYKHMRGQHGNCFCCGLPIKKDALFCSILCKLECNEDNEELKRLKRLAKHEKEQNEERNEESRKSKLVAEQEEKKNEEFKKLNEKRNEEFKRSKLVAEQERAKDKKRTREEEQIGSKGDHVNPIHGVNTAILGEETRPGTCFRKKSRKGIPDRACFQ